MDRPTSSIAAKTPTNSRPARSGIMSGRTTWHDGRRDGAVTIKVIVELKAKPGQRDELQRVFERMLAEHESSLSGFLGSARYEVLDDPDMLVEIADWDSVAARDAHMRESAATNAYAPLLELLAAPFRATVVRQLP